MRKFVDKEASSITHLSTLLQTDQVRVAKFSITPQTQGPIHFHTHVAEHCLCLEGMIHIKKRDESEHPLQAEEQFEIQEGCVHRVSNRTSSPCRHLVIQGSGAYDFQVVD